MPRKSNKNGGWSKPIKEAPTNFFKMKEFVEKSKNIKPTEVFGKEYKIKTSKKK